MGAASPCMFQCLLSDNNLFLNMLQIMLPTPHQHACMRTRSRPGASGHHRWHRAQQPLLPQPATPLLLLPARNRQARVAWRNGHAGLVLVASEHIFAPSRTTSTRRLCLFAAGNHQHTQQHSQSPHLTPPHPFRGPETVRSERDNAVKEPESHRTIIHCRKALAKPDAAIQ